MFGENLCSAKICSFFGIHLVPAKLEEDVRGILFHCATSDIILYNVDLPRKLQCEAIWHEIYHFIFGAEAEPNVFYGEDDIKARTFALHMLHDQVKADCCLGNECVFENVTIQRDWIPMLLALHKEIENIQTVLKSERVL